VDKESRQGSCQVAGKAAFRENTPGVCGQDAGETAGKGECRCEEHLWTGPDKEVPSARNKGIVPGGRAKTALP